MDPKSEGLLIAGGFSFFHSTIGIRIMEKIMYNMEDLWDYLSDI